MNKRRLSFHSARLIIVLSCLALFVLSFLTCLILLYLMQSPGFDPSLVSWLIAMFFIAIIAASIFGVSFFVYSRLFVQSVTMRSFFGEDHPIFNVSHFKRKVRRFTRKKGAKGAMVRINVKGLTTEVLNTYGDDTLRAVNSLVLKTLGEHCRDRRLYAYTFTPLEGFLFYKKTLAQTQFHDEVKALMKEIDDKIANDSSLPSLTLLFGIAWYDEKGLSPDDLLKRAMLASTYNLKTRLTSDFVEYSASILGQVDARTRLGQELTHALEHEELVIYYQAKFDLHTHRFYGAESLIRWNHPERGLLLPSFFIPFAERTGIILDVDRYVFEHVCQDLARWKKEGRRRLVISVNLSRKTVYDPGIIAFYQEKIAQYGIDPSLIDIELTESLAAKDSVFIQSMLKKITALGVKTSIDDFGIGHSSLSSLKSLPFDTLKIDKSFIDDIEIVPESRAMVSSIVSMAHLLHMKTIAEGVETEGQVKILSDLNADAVQGYYYSKPINEYDFTRLLINNRFELEGKEKEEKA